jgi:hypothetical protein
VDVVCLLLLAQSNWVESTYVEIELLMRSRHINIDDSLNCGDGRLPFFRLSPTPLTTSPCPRKLATQTPVPAIQPNDVSIPTSITLNP